MAKGIDQGHIYAGVAGGGEGFPDGMWEVPGEFEPGFDRQVLSDFMVRAARHGNFAAVSVIEEDGSITLGAGLRPSFRDRLLNLLGI